MEKQRKKYLEKHKYSIYQGKDGKWYTTIPNGESGRRKIKRSTKKEIQDVVVDYWRNQEENPTLEQLFCEWNDTRLERKKIARGTYDRYSYVFQRHFGEFGKTKIKDLKPEDVEDFLEIEVARLELTAKAFSSLKSTMLGILKTAKRKRYISFNISDLIDDLDISDRDFRQTIKEDYEEVFDEYETEKIMSYCMDNLDVWNLGILLMFVTGMRVGEVVALKRGDIKDNCISVRRTETRYKNPDGGGYVFDVKDFPKTRSGVREVVIPKDYQFILKRMKSINPFGDYIFVRENGERLNTDCIRKRQARLCRKLNIYHKSPHKVRKTVGTILFDEKLDNNLIRKQMGWSSCVVGETHYHRDRKSIDRKVDIISRIPEYQIK